MSEATRRLAPVTRLAPAKLNLTLAIVGRRADGFHDLHSVFVPLAFADRLSLAPLGPRGQDTLHVSAPEGTPVPDVGPTPANLVLRGIAAARSVVGEGPGRPATPPLAVRLEKHVPVAAGLGGGSSDGAAALLGALEAWGAGDHLDATRRATAAAALGSDVPFFLTGSTALVEGRGERVTPLRGPTGEVGVLIVTPRIELRTPDVFAIHTARSPDGRGDGAVRLTSEHLAAELGRGLAPRDLVARTAVLVAANDLLPAATIAAPGLVTVRRALARVTGRPIGLSGSGPSLWTLYPSLQDAADAAERVRGAIANGIVPTLGDGPPRVIATIIQPAAEVPRP